MSLYEAMKDAVSLAQKADNVELYRQLIDLSAQAFELQAENTRLYAENAELKKQKEISNSIIRHEESFITLSTDTAGIYYCSHCWDSSGLLIQLKCKKNGAFECPHCHLDGIFNQEKYRQAKKAELDLLISMNPDFKSNVELLEKAYLDSI